MAHVTRELLRKHFGPYAEIKGMLFGGWRVTTEDGEVEFHRSSFKNLVGNYMMYSATVLAAEEAWGGFSVQGPVQQIVTTMAVADTLNVRAIPEVKESGGGCLKFFLSMITFIFAAGFLTNILGAFLGFVGGVAAAVAVWKAFNKAQKRRERRAGQVYRHALPPVHGSDRTADRDNAQRQGWL